MRLLPSLRQKKRYLVFEVDSSQEFSLKEIKDAVQQALDLFLGQLGRAKSSPLFLSEKFNLQKQRFLMKVNHKYVDEIKSALILNKTIKNKPVLLKSIITAGTIKKANEVLKK